MKFSRRSAEPQTGSARTNARFDLVSLVAPFAIKQGAALRSEGSAERNGLPHSGRQAAPAGDLPMTVPESQ
jgi:hypothetical protein